MITLKTPLNQQQLKKLKANDFVYITGEIYTARDAAHKRLIADLKANKELPFDLKNKILYYVGPSPTPEHLRFGSAGPTTASRMDPYTPTLLEHGIKAIIAKGYRSEEVRQSFFDNQAVYLLAIGGAGALLGNCVIDSEVIAYDDLGTESIRRLVVKDFPVIVAFDLEFNNAYDLKTTSQ